MKKVYTFFVILIALSCWLSVADAQTVRMPDAIIYAKLLDRSAKFYLLSFVQFGLYIERDIKPLAIDAVRVVNL